MSTFAEKIKTHAAGITAIFTTIATIGGAVLYVETNYANAGDVKSIARNQEQILKSQSLQQRQMSVFQLEYYDDRIRKLQEERRVALERERLRVPSRSINKTPEEILEEINDLKVRRDVVRKSLEQ